MSSPATSCARRWVETASSYCSRQRALTIASRKLRLPICAVCQAGRGKEPMIEVGRILSAVALYMAVLPVIASRRKAARQSPAVLALNGPRLLRRYASRNDDLESASPPQKLECRVRSLVGV